MPKLYPPALICQNQRSMIFEMQWDPSNNSNSFDFDHYQIQYGNSNYLQSTNTTQEGTIISFQNTSIYRISVSTFNRCGQKSAKSIIPVTYPEPTTPQQGTNTTALIAITSILIIVLVLVAMIIATIVLAHITKKNCTAKYSISEGENADLKNREGHPKEQTDSKKSNSKTDVVM